jgi:hypothetical protein
MPPEPAADSIESSARRPEWQFTHGDKPRNMHPSGASPAAQNNARGVSSLPTEVDPFGRIEASVPPEEEPGGTGLGSASGTSPNNGSGSNPGTLSGGVGENAPVAAGSPTGHPPGIPPFIAEVPTLAPVPGAAAPLKPLIGSVSKTVSAGPSTGNPPGGAHATGHPAGTPPLIAEVPELAPVPGAPAPKPLIGSVSKTVSAGPSPGNSPGVPHIPPSIVNGPSYNPRPLQKRITAAANPPGTGASGAQPGPQPQPASRNPFTGALRGVRLFADWIASRWPGGPSGLKAASKASNELKRPYEEQWTKPYGGIQQVGDTFAMHGAGKVAKTVLRAGATKLAQSDAGRKLLQQLAAAAGALGAGGKKLVGSVETASVESAGSAAARKVSTSAAKKLLQKAAIDRKQFLGFWSKGGSVWSSTAAEKRKWATAFKQGERLKLNGYRPYGASVKSLNLNGKSIRTLEQDLPKRGFKRFDDVVRDSNGKPIPGDDGKPVKQIIFVHPDGGMVRIKPYGQPGSPSLLRKTEPHAVKAVMKPGSALTDYNKLDHEYFKVDNQGNPWPAFPNDVSAEAWNLYKDGWAEVVHSFVTP